MIAGVIGVDSVAEFFAMGGYAVYVWPALGLTAVAMTGLAWQSWRRLRREEAATAELERALKTGRASAEQPEGKAEIAA